MPADVAIWYRGANYQLGRWKHGYGVWAIDGSRTRPVAQWPPTPEGWHAAWAWFAASESPQSIVHLGAPADQAGGRPVAVGAAGLLAAGVAVGIAGLFPGYLGGTSLAASASELVPHVIYLAAWVASAVLIASGGRRRRAGALLGLGVSVVSFGLFLADAGTVMSGGGTLQAGLALGLLGWLACTGGAALAVSLPAGDGLRSPGRRPARSVVAVAIASLMALGTAITFAPSWDSYTLRASSGATQYVTAGNSFANPGQVIAGDVAVMIALVVVAVVAALWRPLRLGAALLAGAAVPMIAQAVSALLQVAEPVSSASFGIPPAQAAQAGLTITAGLTAWFWVYCAFTAGLLATCAWMLIPARPAQAGAPGAGFPFAASPGGAGDVAVPAAGFTWPVPMQAAPAQAGAAGQAPAHETAVGPVAAAPGGGSAQSGAPAPAAGLAHPMTPGAGTPAEAPPGPAAG